MLYEVITYFFADNIAGGLEFVLSSASEQDQEEDGKDIQTLFLVGPFFRYFFPMGNNYAYLELEGGFGSFKDKWTGTNDYVDKYSVTAFGGGRITSYNVCYTKLLRLKYSIIGKHIVLYRDEIPSIIDS